MPLPKKHTNETEQDFINRCVPEVIDEGFDQKEAVAVCYSIWDDSKKQSNT